MLQFDSVIYLPGFRQWCSLRNGSYQGMARSTSLRAGSLAVPPLERRIEVRADYGATIKKAKTIGGCAPPARWSNPTQKTAGLKATALIRSISLKLHHYPTSCMTSLISTDTATLHTP